MLKLCFELNKPMERGLMKKTLVALLFIVLMSANFGFAESSPDSNIWHLQQAIRSHLDVTTLPPVRCKALYRVARVQFVIQPGGKITHAQLLQTSFNSNFDSALLNAIQKSSPLAPSWLAQPKNAQAFILEFPDMLHLQAAVPVPGRRFFNPTCRISPLNF
jgi:TonB family protein